MVEKRTSLSFLELVVPEWKMCRVPPLIRRDGCPGLPKVLGEMVKVYARVM